MPDDVRVFPGAPTHLRGWDAWMQEFEQEQALLQKLVLTHKPEICDTASGEIHWLEKHVAQTESGDQNETR